MNINIFFIYKKIKVIYNSYRDRKNNFRPNNNSKIKNKKGFSKKHDYLIAMRRF